MNTAKVKGSFFAICAAISYGLNPFFGIPLYAEGMLPLSVLFYRFAFAAVLTGLVLPLTGNTFRLPVKYLLPTIVAGILMALTCLLWFLSFRIMDTGIAATMLFVYPALVAVIMWGVFREKLNTFTLAGIVTAFGGVILLCQSGGNNISIAGIALIMGSALAYAVYIVLVKVSPLKEFSPFTMTFYAMLISVIILLIPLRMGFDLQMLPSWRAFGYATGLALFPSLCAFLFTAIAVKHIGATQTAVLGALEPVTAVTVGILVFHETLTVKTVCGIVMIIMATVTVICGTQKKQEHEISTDYEK
ncbi:MAG: EamA/RhaT family transporter [Lentisphaerae bacterium]|nr:EamA/RhaT family transporter [Lentisphaerota bacterium]